jgi:arylsulfatase A-like enzyme/Flp pilus assembly protein TadD
MSVRVIALASGLACLAACARAPAPAPTFPRAPIVLISIDTLRADHLPAYGYKAVETPHLDALRRDAILFENAYAPAPLTFPSHASLFTGRLPPTHGVRDNVGYDLDPAKHATLAALLKAGGYATGGAVSAWVMRGRSGLGHGFDVYDDDIAVVDPTAASSQVRRAGGATAQRALAWLAGQAAHPYFLFVHLYEPHSPYAPPEPWKSRYPLAYDATIAAADAVVGQLLDALRKRGDYERAIVLVVSDHGEGLSQHGEEFHGILLYREALHVPVLLKLPGQRDAGTSVATPVGLVDLLPTLTGLVGLPSPSGLDGGSLLDPVRRRTASPGLYAETEYPRIHLGWSGLRSLIDARFHLIDGPAPELYDVVQDPTETVNVAAREPAALAAMTRVLRAQGGPFTAPQAVPEEQAEKLRALGYLAGGPGTPSGVALPDPKSRIHSLAQVRAAFELVNAGKDEAAVVAFRALLAANPDFFDARYELGRSLARLGRFEEAARVFSDLGARSPALLEPVAIAQARVMLALGRDDEAAASARVGMALSPAQAHEVLARVALRRNDLASAEQEARLARGSPPAREASFLLGDILARLGRNAEAAAAFQEEIRSFPDNAPAYARLAIVYALEGRKVSEVRAVLEGMVRADPRPATARLAAETLESLGDRETATAWRRRAEALNPRR